MTRLMPTGGVIDPIGRLIAADAELGDLQLRLGGEMGEQVILPGVASLANIVRRLGVPISRPVRIGFDEEEAIDCWAKAWPDGDEVRFTLSVMRDLGDRLHEDHAEESEKTAPVLSWVTDPSLGIVEIAPELAELAGAGPEPLIGQSLTRLFKLAENEDGEMPLVQAVAARKPFDAQPAELRLGDGTRLLLSGKPMRDEDGVFTGYMGRAEELVESEAEDAEGDEDASLSSLIEDLSGRIGAALKEPLDLIIANADSIRSQTDGPLRNGYANYASDIAEAGRHLVGLVNDLIEVQTIEKTDFQPVIEDIDLADVARRAAGLLAVRAAESGVRLDRPAEDEVIPARGDFRRALQVLVNLIGNGIRYSPPEGMIWIRAEQEGGNAAVIVADQGHGIAPEDQERIFEKFERLDPTEAGGSGLGLYISRTLARAMGGDILVDSALGQGARFIFTLPAS